MKNEQKFISECIKAFLGNTNSKKLKKLYSSIDTSKFGEIIASHNIEGIFYFLYHNHNFKNIDIPPYMVQNWKKISGKNSLTNTINDSEALNIAEILNKNNIDYIYIKGLAIRNHCYSRDYLKCSTDIDLFINKSDYQKVKKLLLINGYKIPYQHYVGDLSVKIPFEEYEKHTYEISFVKKQGGLKFIIDLQWDCTFSDREQVFSNLFGIDFFYRLDSAIDMEIDQKRLRVFPIEVELINMAFHYAFGHGFKGLKWLIDLCTFIKEYKEDIDFDFILSHANKNLTKIVGIILMLAYEYNGWPKLSKKEKGKFCIGSLLPLEYRLYKKMAFRPARNGVLDKIYLRLVKALLPYNAAGRLRVIKYLFFNKDSISHRLSPEREVNKFLLPFSLIKLMFTDIIRERR